MPYRAESFGIPATEKSPSLTNNREPLTVQLPQSVEVYSDFSADSSCAAAGLVGVTGHFRDIKYQVMDQVGTAIQQAGMSVREIINLTNDTCGFGLPTAGSWTTNASGVMTAPDEIVLCATICDNGGIVQSRGISVSP